MGGVVQAVAKPLGLAKATPAGQAVQAQAEKIEDRAAAKASRMDEEQGARMRGARRRGRQLLSDARLNAEAGVETLGGGNSLGQ
jgi:vacuolar-type H+-ATPase subunit E/Vma4